MSNRKRTESKEMEMEIGLKGNYAELCGKFKRGGSESKADNLEPFNRLVDGLYGPKQ